MAKNGAQAPGKLVFVQKHGAGMVFRGTGPLNAAGVQTFIGEAGVGRRHFPDFLKDLLGILIIHGVAHAARDLGNDLPILLRSGHWRDCLPHPGHPPLSVAEGAFFFRKSDRRQDHVGQLRRFGEENILNHQEIQSLHFLDGMIQVGVGDHRVLPHDIQGLDTPLQDGRQHVGHGHAHIIGQAGDAPGVFHLLAVGRIGDHLVPGEDVGQAAHVAGALNIVLAPQGVDAAAQNAHIAGEHGQVGQGLDVVGAHGVLGNAHTVNNGGSLGLGIEPGGLDQIRRGHAADLFHIFRGVLGHRFFQGLKIFGAFGHVVGGLEIFFDNDVHDAVNDRDVGARLLAQPEGGMFHQVNAPGVDDDQGLIVIPRRPFDPGPDERDGFRWCWNR